MGSKERDEFDALLDDALRSYSGAEPRFGLEERIVRRVRVEGGAPRRVAWFRRWYALMPAAAGALVLLVVVLVRFGHQSLQSDPAMPARPGPQVAKVAPAPVTPMAPARMEPVTRRAVKRTALVKEAVPKRPMFPDSAPMTDEERALVRLVTSYPQQAAAMVKETPERGIEPLHFEAIRIEPLKNGS